MLDQRGFRIVAAVLLEQADHPELMERFQHRVFGPVRETIRDVLLAGVNRGDLHPGSANGEVIDILAGAFWARTWATETFAADWSSRIVSAILQGISVHPGR